jgi:uncharacterized coiled-coil DUF342 family protein
MKVTSIFSKNLKIVSRNWSYFVVLFICPILLILVSGATLNSNDFANIRIGIIDLDPGYDFNLGKIKNVKRYSSLTNCLYDLANSKTAVCMYVREQGGKHQIDVHLDNTVKRIEYYARQFVLENILQEQTYQFEKTSDEINAQLTLYSTNIGNAKQELQQVKTELEDQEAMLLRYRENLTEIRNDFNEIYYTLKQAEPTISQLKQEIGQNNENLQGNITEFRQAKQEIDFLIASLKTYLQANLDPAEYSHAETILNSITSELDEMDQILSDIERMQRLNQQLLPLLEDLDEIIEKLDDIKQTLDQLDGDLEKAIQTTRQSKERVNTFIMQLDDATTEIQEFSGSLSSNQVATSFKEAFPIDAKPVFFVFPLLVAIIITFTSLVLSNMFILKQVNQPSYFRDMITPTNDTTFLTADYLINLFFIAIQGFVLFLVGYYWFNLTFDNLGIFVIAVFLASTIFIFLGMSISYLIRNQSLSMLLTIFLLILLLILSDVLAPSVLSGNTIKFLIDLNPFVILTRVLKDTIILGKTLSQVASSIIKLGTFLIIALAIGYLSKKVCREDIVK